MKKVFISYSHFDSPMLKDLKRHFVPFENSVVFWDDSKIAPGSLWKDEITKAIDECTIAVLLISADFLASDFVRNNELPKLLDSAEVKGTTILGIYLKPCAVQFHPQLTKYQFLNNISLPVSSMNENQREELWSHTITSIINIQEKASELQQTRLPIQNLNKQANTESTARDSIVHFKLSKASKDVEHYIFIDGKKVGLATRAKPLYLTIKEGEHHFDAEATFYHSGGGRGERPSHTNRYSNKLYQFITPGKKYYFECGFYNVGFWQPYDFAIKLIDVISDEQ